MERGKREWRVERGKREWRVERGRGSGGGRGQGGRGTKHEPRKRESDVTVSHGGDRMKEATATDEALLSDLELKDSEHMDPIQASQD